ncbi:hypothetical protein MMC16_006973 [Acarospora aff. strigata]|nr:hypothetical protein [Acarospora aff. strigata]
MPLIAFQHILFILPFYFLTRLQVDAGKFFFFYLTLFISTINFSNLLRMFSYYVASLDDCFRYGGTACTVLLLFAGFLIPAAEMRACFGWLHWLNPMYYAYENLFVNEFDGLILSCADGSLIPAINGANPAYQACNIAGARPGQSSVSGADYASAYGASSSHRWRNIGIMIGIAIAYLIVGVIGSEIMNFTPQESHFVDLEKSAAVLPSEETSLNSTAGDHAYKHEPGLTWKNITVTYGEKQALTNITGSVKPGDFTALCGACGAGKTTLLTALSQTNFSGQLEGEVLFGGIAPGPAFKKSTGFAQQMDLHDGTATAREARVRGEGVDLLDLKKVENALIGDAESGLGVELTKRVTIGVELTARPKILFADEPTSGLDSQGAAHIVHYLRVLAQQGQAVFVTIHQPSASLFSEFDRLLALSSEGQQLYFGRVDAVIPYFERYGAICPPDTNPTEFVLETVGAGSNWATNWAESPEAGALVEDIAAIEVRKALSDVEDNDRRDYNASTTQQTLLLPLRILKNQWRNTPYLYSKIWVHVVSAILVGFTFFQLGTSPRDLQNRTFSVYFIVFLVNAIINTILLRFFFARLYWEFREGPAKTYSWVALCSASVLAEMPGALVCTVLYYVLWYFPSGLPHNTAGYIFLFTLTYEIFQVLLGLFMMAMSPDLGFAGNVLVFIVCIANWFNGIIVPYDQLQVFWRYWLYYLSPFTYLLGGMVTAVNKNLAVTCSAADLTTFSPPPGQTCGQYAGAWATSAAAQLLNPSATANCSVCKWTNGDQYLATFHLGGGMWGGIWGYWGIFLLFTVSNLALVYAFTWATKVKYWKLFYFF